MAVQDAEGERKTYNNALSQLLRFLKLDNICEELDSNTIAKVGRQVCRDYETDEASRKEWLDKNKEAMELARQISKEKSHPWPGAANVKFPILTEAVIQFNSRAYQQIVQGNSVVKGVVDYAEDEDGDQAQKRADDIAEHLNYQLLYEMEEWEEDTDKLLINLPLVGNVFRKTYYSPSLKRNVSEMVTAENLVYNYDAPSFERAPRHTHIIKMYPREIEERQRMEIFREVDLKLTPASDEDQETPQTLLEQHCYYDLDGDDYKEPYIVTVHKDTKEVLRIVPRFDREDITIKHRGEQKTIGEIEEEYREKVMEAVQAYQQYQMQAMMIEEQTGRQMPDYSLEALLPTEPSFKRSKVCRVEPTCYFTKYSFIPSLDGGAYDMGFGWLLNSLTHTIDTTINQMLDAGTSQNAGGGWISNAIQTRKGEQYFKPGEYKTVEIPSGGNIQNHIYDFKHPGPSNVLFNLLGTLIEAANNISSIKDALRGDGGPAQEPASRYMARLEQGLATFNSIFKRIHRSMCKEFRRLHKLNREYGPKQTNVRFNGRNIRFSLEEYREADVKLVPVSDPTVFSQAQRLAKAEALIQSYANDPYVDQHELRRRHMEALDTNDLDELLYSEEHMQQQQAQQPPHPELLKAQAEVEKLQAETQKTLEEVGSERAQKVKFLTEAMQNMAKAEAEDDKVNLEYYRAQMDVLNREIEELRQDEREKRQAANEQGGNRSQSANGGRASGMVQGQNNPQGAATPGGQGARQGARNQ
jgi:chaperonin GroES